MITSDLISYIKKEREKTTTDASIRSTLAANGWNEADISEGFSVFSSGDISAVPKPNISNIQLQKYRNKVKWNTFISLLILDILIIVLYKVTAGTYGVFGLSFISVISRLLVIYLIAAYSSREASIEKSAGRAVAKSIGKVIGTVIVTIVVVLGIFFASCMFLLSTRGF